MKKVRKVLGMDVEGNSEVMFVDVEETREVEDAFF